MKIKVYDYDLKGSFGFIEVNPKYVRMMQEHLHKNKIKFYWLWIEGFDGYIINQKDYLKLKDKIN
mgnify:CR=1 FL=1